jgi:hypothetical protein
MEYWGMAGIVCDNGETARSVIGMGGERTCGEHVAEFRRRVGALTRDERPPPAIRCQTYERLGALSPEGARGLSPGFQPGKRVPSSKAP